MKPAAKSKKEQALDARLKAALVEVSGSLCRSDQEAIRDTLHDTSVQVGMGLYAPQSSPIAWGFRAILEKDDTFSLLHDRQGTRSLDVLSDADRAAFKKFVDTEVLPVLQHNSTSVVHGSETRFYHFKWNSPLGLIRAATTTYGRSGYVYGIVYLEAA